MGSPAIAMTQRHYLVVARVHAGELNRCLIRLRAAVGEIGLTDRSRGYLGQLLGQRNHGFIGKYRRGVLQLVDLRLDLACDPRLSVSYRDRHDTTEEIQILVPVD